MRSFHYRYRHRLGETLRTHRADLKRFSEAIRARTSGKQAGLFARIDFEVLLQAFPVWLVNLTDIYEVLPLCGKLFDVAIIDEATQCDIASCLPVLIGTAHAFQGEERDVMYLSFAVDEEAHAGFAGNGFPASRNQISITLYLRFPYRIYAADDPGAPLHCQDPARRRGPRRRAFR